MNKMVDLRNASSLSFTRYIQQDVAPLAGMLSESDVRDHVGTCGDKLRLVTEATAVPETLKGSVMLLGNFDGVHLGHRALMATALAGARRGGKPLGVMSVEPHPRQFFAPQSDAFRLSTPATKRETFGRLGVDFLYSPRFDRDFAGQEPEQFIDDILAGAFKVSCLVVGRGFRFGRQRRGDVEMLRRFGRRYGFAVTAVDEVRWNDVTCSSTLVRNLVVAGDIDAANRLLERPWSVELGAVSPSVVRTGEGAVTWHQAVLRPACGHYQVALRGAGESRPFAHGRLSIASSGEMVLSLARVRATAPNHLAPFFLDFLARADV